MLTENFNYNLPPELIAQKPAKPRDSARLLVIDRRNGKMEHGHFFNIADYFQKDDILVLNDSKVIPARLEGAKETGGKVEIFLLRKHSSRGRRGKGDWFALIKGKVKNGQKIKLAKNVEAAILENNAAIWRVRFNASDEKLFSLGKTPLPPYIKNSSSKSADYQTVFAKPQGSVAAPTAGLHFTKKLLAKLKKKGVKIIHITLHVGLGTFAPVKTAKIEEHQIHSELAIVSAKTARAINEAKIKGARIFACGTTSVRTLEAFADNGGDIAAGKKWVNIYIYPGYKFKCVDAIITNFHLPKSTLIMLVSAFASSLAPCLKDGAGGRSGINLIKTAYQEAIKQKYKFYSFGDAMLII